MLELNFTIKGEPTEKGRAKFFGGHAVTPKKTRTYGLRTQNSPDKIYHAEFLGGDKSEDQFFRSR